MSSAPTIKEREFVLKVRCALDECVANLPTSTVNRLAAARHAALERKRPEAQPVFAWAFASSTASSSPLTGKALHPSFTRRLLRAWPLIALLIGIIGIAQWENMQHTAELADIDAAMLSDELPLGAYLDHGFNTYLSHTR